MRPAQIHAALKRESDSRGRAFTELLTLYALERFLARLTLTPYSRDLILKGGVLLAAYRLRRPTRDIDMQLVDVTLDEQHLRDVVDAVATVGVQDGLVLDPTRTRVEAIRDDDEYSGLRVHVPATVHTFTMDLKLDVSTGDAIYPAPQIIELPALLHGSVRLLGHPLPTVVAEKTVTVLQRGTTGTRWRDFVDVRALARTYPFSASELATAAAAVAAHRQVQLAPLAAVTQGYGVIAQTKWASWVRRNDLGGSVEARFDDQLADVIAFIDPVYAGQVNHAAVWDPDRYAWHGPGD